MAKMHEAAGSSRVIINTKSCILPFTRKNPKPYAFYSVCHNMTTASSETDIKKTTVYIQIRHYEKMLHESASGLTAIT